MDNCSIAWAAGLLEGEGSFTCEKSKNPLPSIRITCGQKDPEILYKLHNIFNCGTIRKQTTREFWIWRVNKKNDVFKVINHIYSYMSTKRRHEINKQISIYHQSPNKRNWIKYG